MLTPEGNLASYIDRALLGRHLLNQFSDPEGLLSTLPAIATRDVRRVRGRLAERAACSRTIAPGCSSRACVATVAGLAWGRVFPINKNLWTSSFALFSARARGAGARPVPLARRRAGLARLVAAARGLRTQSAGWPISSRSASTASSRASA